MTVPMPEPDARQADVMARALDQIPDYVGGAVEAAVASLGPDAGAAEAEAALAAMIDDLETELRRRAH